MGVNADTAQNVSATAHLTSPVVPGRRYRRKTDPGRRLLFPASRLRRLLTLPPPHWARAAPSPRLRYYPLHQYRL